MAEWGRNLQKLFYLILQQLDKINPCSEQINFLIPLHLHPAYWTTWISWSKFSLAFKSQHRLFPLPRMTFPLSPPSARLSSPTCYSWGSLGFISPEKPIYHPIHPLHLTLIILIIIKITDQMLTMCFLHAYLISPSQQPWGAAIMLILEAKLTEAFRDLATYPRSHHCLKRSPWFKIRWL